MSRGIALSRIVLAVGLVLLVVGAKLWVVDMAGSSVPYRDQIDAEGESIIRPWTEGRLSMGALFAPHNEHHVIFTKFLALAGVALNGQWDAYVQLVTNALLHALLLLLVMRWMSEVVSGWRLVLLGSLAVLMWLLPLDWENTLGGFQSQVYLVLILSFLHLRGVLGTDQIDRRWISGQICGLFSMGAMASGVFSSVAIMLVVAARVIRRRTFDRFAGITLGIAGLWLVIALISRVSVPGHESLRADSLGEFVAAAVQVLAWPWQSFLPWSLVACAPAVAMAVLIWRKPDFTPSDRIYLGVLFWMVVTIAATAWLRGEGSPLISRYLTAYVFLVLVQGLALAAFRPGFLRSGLLIAWAALITVGFGAGAKTILQKRLPGIAERQEAQGVVLRDYFATKDTQRLLSADPRTLPYPSAETLVMRWQYPTIQDVMPAAIRKALPISSAPIVNDQSLPPAPYPVIVASPRGPQTEPWTWRSERQSATIAPILRFRILGGLGDPETALSLRICNDQDSWEILPDGPARNRWKTINVVRPAGEWWLELEDNDSVDRIALAAPVELGWLSWAAEKLIKHHFWWFSAGVVLITIGLFGRVGLHLKHSRPDSGTGSTG